MRTPLVLSLLGTALMSVGSINAYAAPAPFFNPGNVLSKSGSTTGYEINKTVGCPGRGILDKPCVEEDQDKDGVGDWKDKCPNTPAGRKVNADGCELDSDGDGVVDGLDKCPGTPAGRKVNADGCELDSDGDGVVDANDACPTVYAKTADGCPIAAAAPAPAPVVAAPVVAMVLGDVLFDHDKATLGPNAPEMLDKAVAYVQEKSGSKFELAGHTDSAGKDAYNTKLSQRRADTVRKYMIDKGVAADRITAKGYGETKPVADNATAEGRAKNRRVELVTLP